MELKKRLEQAVDTCIAAGGIKKLRGKQQLFERVKTAKTVCAFGCGTMFMGLFYHGLKNISGLRIDILADNDPEKHGKKYYGISCVSPQELRRYSDIVVIITVMEQKAICRQLEEMGVEFYSYEEFLYDPSDLKYDAGLLRQEKARMLEALDWLTDDESKKVYVDLLCQRINASFAERSYLDMYSPGQYFYQSFLEISSNETLVDGGAYTGDTIFEFVKFTNNHFAGIHSFELDAGNFSQMENQILSSALDLHKIHLYNAGLWDMNEELQYGGEFGSKAVGLGTQKAKGVKLDEILENEKVTFIKLDVEGAEPRALAGARRIICEQKPKMAVCVYHELSHFWEVPEIIKSFVPDYRLALRHHGLNVWETVLYAY